MKDPLEKFRTIFRRFDELTDVEKQEPRDRMATELSFAQINKLQEEFDPNWIWPSARQE